MSRAFVKELEDAAEELPERPISPHPNVVTAEGLAHIEGSAGARRRPGRERPHRAGAHRARLALLDRAAGDGAARPRA